ncbi:phage late control D family protein [Bradyrhizobium sp. 613_E4_N2_2]|uniref:phage late control D family protein n=1 Tax=Bradyrhizobium sp. 613_E4_N2_2 TaxID=3240371 RepID=UPI003F8B8329
MLADTDPLRPIKKPPTGAELEVFIGYDGTTRRMGMFVVDEIELEGWPQTMTIRARASTYEGTPKGKTDFQTQKTHSWPAGTTIGAMVSKMAKDHGMESAVSPSLASVQLPHIDQTAESDISFLVRLARKYDAIAKPAGGKLLFVKRGDSKSASGADMPAVTVVPSDLKGFSYSERTRESPGTVVAFWHDKGKAKHHEVIVGKGDPVKRLRFGFKNEDMAKSAAEAELSRRARGEISLELTLPGDENLSAEATVVLGDEFRAELAGEWLATRVVHRLTKKSWTTTVECERPNSNKDVQDATSGGATDTDE